jgi:hypothetical protein
MKMPVFWFSGTSNSKVPELVSWKTTERRCLALCLRNENIHSRSGFVWRHPGHAALCCQPPGDRTADCQRLKIHHYMTSKRWPDYLQLLELGREYPFRELNQPAIQTLGEYLAQIDLYPAGLLPAEFTAKMTGIT